MPDLINKLSSYAALIGVVGAIGGGFYAWGEFNTRLSAIEGVNQTVDLTDTHDRIVLGDKETMDAVRAIGATLEAIKKDIAINGAAIEYLDAKINELKAANDNPLLN
jgi:hypothetical protein